MAKIWNSWKTPVKLALYSPVVDMAGHGDVSIQTTGLSCNPMLPLSCRIRFGRVGPRLTLLRRCW